MLALGIHRLNFSASDAVTAFRPCTKVNQPTTLTAKRSEWIGLGVDRRVPALRASDDSGHVSEVAVNQFEIDILFVQTSALHTSRQDESDIEGIFVGTDLRHTG